MARPREFNEEAVLGSAMMAFWRHGYHATGVQELVDATGVNRASLYGTFGNKEQFFISALKRYIEICLENLRTALARGGNAVEGIRHMLEYFMDNLLQQARGCLLYNTALEASGQHAAIRSEVEVGMERIEALLTDWVCKGQAAGEVDAERDAVLLARTVMAAMHSMTVRSGGGASAEVLRTIRDGAMLIFGMPAPR